jgi:hypothetical protein
MPKSHDDHLFYILHAFRASQQPEIKWVLAQALAALADPSIQANLDAVRREIVETYGSKDQTPATGNNHGRRRSREIFVHKRAKGKARWSDYQITPEIDTHLALVGTTIPKETARRLKRALTAQISLINDLTTRSPK